MSHNIITSLIFNSRFSLTPMRLNFKTNNNYYRPKGTSLSTTEA